MARTFEDYEAKRERVPLFVGLVGPSGGGKTYSALRLATGIQRVTGGEIFVVDTEAKRALHYAEGYGFRFRHVPFGAPFGPMEYLAAIEHCVRKGAKTIIVDSMSHEHEGPGGVLEMHERELDRLAGDDWGKRNSMNMLAWAKPKGERRRFINTLTQMQLSAIFCFRAKEKIKLPKKGDKDREPKPLGWMPIAGEEFVYEMTLNALLLPAAGGVPTWHSEELGERQMVKLPEQFKKLFAEQRPFSEDIGEQLARWAEGTQPAPAVDVDALLATIAKADGAELDQLRPTLEGTRGDTRSRLAAAVKARRKTLEAPPPTSTDEPPMRQPGED